MVTITKLRQLERSSYRLLENILIQFCYFEQYITQVIVS